MPIAWRDEVVGLGLGLFEGQGIKETLHIVAGRTDVVARRDELLPVRLLGRPLSSLDRGQGRAGTVEDAVAAPIPGCRGGGFDRVEVRGRVV